MNTKTEFPELEEAIASIHAAANNPKLKEELAEAANRVHEAALILSAATGVAVEAIAQAFKVLSMPEIDASKLQEEMEPRDRELKAKAKSFSRADRRRLAKGGKLPRDRKPSPLLEAKQQNDLRGNNDR